jgi:hypothetical protein
LLLPQLSEELTGHPIDGDANREEESVWIHNQLIRDGFLSLVGKEQVNREIDHSDIVNVLNMLHTHKFEVRKPIGSHCIISYV